MRVSIEHSEKTTGWISKTRYPMISLKVEFSEEEKQIIKEAKIEKVVILERDHSADFKTNLKNLDDIFNITFGGLLYKQEKGTADEYCVRSPGEAREYEAELKDKLRQAKDYLERNRGIKEKSSSFEL